MQVISNFNDNYPEDPIRFFEFESFEKRAKDCELFIGGWPHPTLIREPATVEKYFLSTEEQAWQQDGTDQFIPYVKQIFTICPPKYTNREKRKSVFFPFNPKYIPENNEKTYDVIYTGNPNHETHVQKILNTITTFPNYRHVSFNNTATTTNANVNYIEKLKLISQTKITIIHNLVNGSPQLKSRPFEAGFCRSLMLVMKDQFNIIEEWFEPEIDFIYFDIDSLKNTLEQLITNFENYQKIIDNAFNKCMKEYTTEKFVEKYIGWKYE